VAEKRCEVWDWVGEDFVFERHLAEMTGTGRMCAFVSFVQIVDAYLWILAIKLWIVYQEMTE
jgi:hypothetical protein